MAPEDQNEPDPNYPTRDLGPDPMAQGTPDEAKPESEREAEEEVVEEESRGTP
jgi:hypothetical protein